MKAYGMYQGWVLKEIDGVQIDGKTYSVEQIKAVLSLDETISRKDAEIRELNKANAAYVDANTALLSRLSDAEARIAKLLQDYDAAYNRGLKDGNWQSVEQQQAIHAAEARAEAAEALLKEVVTAWEALSGGEQSVRAVERWLANDMKPVIDKLRHARAIHHKIGVKDE